MFTRPGDLPDGAVAAAVEQWWRFRVASLEYQAVGFGSHHWLAADAAGRRVFATVDDLGAKLRTAGDSADAVFGRLEAAFATAGRCAPMPACPS